MNNEISIFNSPKPVIIDGDFQLRLTKFSEALNNPPTANEIKEHPYIKIKKVENGQIVKTPMQFLPIEWVEQKLNHYFHGLWQTVNFKYSVIVNEIVGDLELCIYHPEAGIWLRRAGTGAVVIQQRAEYTTDEQGNRVKSEQDLLDINRKISNTLEKDMGHLKSDCIKNAAKSFGRAFGSDLSRTIEDISYADISLTPEMVLLEIKDIETQNELVLYFETLPPIARNDKRIKAILKEKELELKSKAREEVQGG